MKKMTLKNIKFIERVGTKLTTIERDFDGSQSYQVDIIFDIDEEISPIAIYRGAKQKGGRISRLVLSESEDFVCDGGGYTYCDVPESSYREL